MIHIKTTISWIQRILIAFFAVYTFVYTQETLLLHQIQNSDDFTVTQSLHTVAHDTDQHIPKHQQHDKNKCHHCFFAQSLLHGVLDKGMAYFFQSLILNQKRIFNDYHWLIIKPYIHYQSQAPPHFLV